MIKTAQSIRSILALATLVMLFFQLTIVRTPIVLAQEYGWRVFTVPDEIPPKSYLAIGGVNDNVFETFLVNITVTRPDETIDTHMVGEWFEGNGIGNYAVQYPITMEGSTETIGEYTVKYHWNYSDHPDVRWDEIKFKVSPPSAVADSETIEIETPIPYTGRNTAAFKINITSPTDCPISVEMRWEWFPRDPGYVQVSGLGESVDVEAHNFVIVDVPSFSVGSNAKPGCFPIGVTWIADAHPYSYEPFEFSIVLFVELIDTGWWVLGDLDGDGDVDFWDAKAFVDAWKAGNCDIDGDGDTDLRDARLFIRCYIRFWTIYTDP